MSLRLQLAAALVVSVAALAACGGGGSSGSSGETIPVTSPTPSGGASPTGGALHASVSSIAFAAGSAQTVTVSETGYTGMFRESDTCDPLSGEIAAVTAPPTQSGGSATFSVLPIGPGVCAVMFGDTNGASVNVSVTVSAAAITVQ